MTIRIETKDTFIPIHLGDLELRFQLGDDSLIDIQKRMKEVHNSLEEIEMPEDDEKALPHAKKVIRNAYDEMFGEGTFDKVYKVSPSLIIVADYFYQIMDGILKELGNRGFTDKTRASKYLKK